MRSVAGLLELTSRLDARFHLLEDGMERGKEKTLMALGGGYWRTPRRSTRETMSRIPPTSLSPTHAEVTKGAQDMPSARPAREFHLSNGPGALSCCVMASAQVPPGFDPDAAVAWLPRQAELLPAADVTLQLDPKAAVEPAGIALLASLIAAREAEGRKTQVVGNEKVIGRLRALEPVTDLKSARRQGDAMAETLEEMLPQAASSVLRAARFVCEELGANIVQHSERPETGFGAMAAWPERGEGRFQIAFCDAGIGFLASLSRNAEFASRVADDGEAIQLAVEKGLSGTEGRANMGMGLGLLLDLSDRLGADLRIVSGTALWHRRTATRDHRVGTLRAVPRLLGAWICLDAPAFPS